MSRRPHRLSDRIEPLLAVASRASRLCEARACRRVAAGLADGGRFDKGGVEHAAWGWSMPPAVAVVAFWALRLGLDVKLVEKLVEAQPIAESHLGVWGDDSTDGGNERVGHRGKQASQRRVAVSATRCFEYSACIRATPAHAVECDRMRCTREPRLTHQRLAQDQLRPKRADRKHRRAAVELSFALAH